MKKLKIYLETSVWNFVFADDAPEKMAITQEFFELVRKGVYHVYISDVVLAEINRASDDTKKKLLDLIEEIEPENLELTQEAEDLAAIYLERKIVPEKKVEDALYVAVATLEELDALVSWNYRHLANLRKSDLFFGVNLEQGFHKKLEIVTPLEVMDYVENG